MTRTSGLSAAAIVTAALLFAVPAIAADTAQANDVTAQFASATLPIDHFRAVEIGGIVVLRGDALNSDDALRAGDFAKTLGYARVANLVRVIDPPDDVAIERYAERQLATRQLDGCRFRVNSDRGVVHVTGTVKYELQKDLAISLLRTIDGVREVRMEAAR